MAVRLFGGVPRLTGTTTGRWANERGDVFQDACYVYAVRVEGLISRGRRVRRLVGFARSHYAQEAIFVTYLGASEIL